MVAPPALLAQTLTQICVISGTILWAIIFHFHIYVFKNQSHYSTTAMQWRNFKTRVLKCKMSTPAIVNVLNIYTTSLWKWYFIYIAKAKSVLCIRMTRYICAFTHEHSAHCEAYKKDTLQRHECYINADIYVCMCVCVFASVHSNVNMSTLKFIACSKHFLFALLKLLIARASQKKRRHLANS